MTSDWGEIYRKNIGLNRPRPVGAGREPAAPGEAYLSRSRSVEQVAVRFLSNLAMICLSRRSTPLNSTWRRYFGQKTTWYLDDKTMLRFGLHSIQGYAATVYIVTKRGAFLPIAKGKGCARAF